MKFLDVLSKFEEKNLFTLNEKTFPILLKFRDINSFKEKILNLKKILLEK